MGWITIYFIDGYTTEIPGDFSVFTRINNAIEEGKEKTIQIAAFNGLFSIVIDKIRVVQFREGPPCNQ